MQRRIGVLLVILLLLGGVVSAQEDEFQAVVDQAQQAYRAGNLEQAEELYQEAISLDEQNAALYYNLGNVYYDMGSYTEAISAYEGSLERGGEDLRVFYNLGNAYYEGGNFDAALEAYQEAREAGEGEGPDGQLSVNTAKSLRQLGRDQEARGLLQGYLAENGNDALGWFHLGNIAYDAGEYEAAASHFSRAVEEREEFSRAQFNLGNTLYLLGSYREAAAAFEAVISRDPEHRDAIYNLGLTYISLAESLTEEEE